MTTHSSRIPVTLVTGFLGSGKTTFINAALKAPELRNAVVVVNEFGEVGLDHSLFAASSDAVVVLENGCLCCTVRGDLVATLNGLYHDRAAKRIPAFDRIIVETSGLAEPAPVMQAFLSEPTLDGLFRIARVITLVDAVNWGTTSGEHDEAVRQVALADRLLLTKLDLVAGDRETATARLHADLRHLNPSAKFAAVDFSSAAVASLLTDGGFDAAELERRPTGVAGCRRASRATAANTAASPRDLRYSRLRSRRPRSSAYRRGAVPAPCQSWHRKLRAHP